MRHSNSDSLAPYLLISQPIIFFCSLYACNPSCGSERSQLFSSFPPLFLTHSLRLVVKMPHTDPFMMAEHYIQRILSRLPASISRFLGYRDQKLPPSPTWVACLWGFIGAFGGLGILFAVFGHTDYFTDRSVPALVASYVRVSHVPIILSLM